MIDEIPLQPVIRLASLNGGSMTTDTGQSLAEDVERHIRDALASSGHNDDARAISVHMVGECAVVSGMVHRWAEHKAAEAAALATPGVRRVDNRLALLVKAHVCR